jgi:UDP-N-acetylmuramoyl-tripeptide--D-alanyl-D-alanine ligase
MGEGDLFVAFRGENTDGNRYVGDALRRGAKAVICEAHAQEQAQAAGATVIDCRRRVTDRPGQEWAAAETNALTEAALVYLVDDTTAALHQVAGFHRVHRSNPELSVIGITGSVGKTSTKELTAAVVGQHFRTLHNKGNLNSEQGLPLTLLELTADHERAVLEMGMYALGEIRSMCELARPRVGVITNVGPVHLSRLGSIEAIAQAKAELVQSLPSADDGGIAILNWMTSGCARWPISLWRVSFAMG